MIDPETVHKIKLLPPWKQQQYLLCAKRYVQTGNLTKSISNFPRDVQIIFSATKFTELNLFIQDVIDIL